MPSSLQPDVIDDPANIGHPFERCSGFKKRAGGLADEHAGGAGLEFPCQFLIAHAALDVGKCHDPVRDGGPAGVQRGGNPASSAGRASPL